MNILYLSHLSGASYAGPTYSVPKQIEAQSKIDNVFWYNASKSENAEWKSLPFYHDITEYPQESIDVLPEPFNHPNIVVVELFYNMTRSNLRRELVRSNIPYVIIPRGELTIQAQVRKGLKKKIANILFCNKYARRAAAIQYLTNQERDDSGTGWNRNAIVIPNGITLPDMAKKSFSTDGIRCVSIGRIEPYQKGLDMLIDACEMIKPELERANVTVTICGPDKENKLQSLKMRVVKKGLENIISFHNGVYGKEKEQLLLDSDVFLIPSRFEGHPMALIEALSYGLPCVATTGSNMREEVGKADAGWTADNDVNSIARALQQMIWDRTSMDLKSRNAVLLASLYSWDKISMISNTSYAEICQKSSQCRGR